MSEPRTTRELVEFLRDNPEESAWSLVGDRLPGWERRFRAACRQLKKLLEEAQREFPEACYYTASGGFELVLGATHGYPDDQLCETAHPELSAIGNGCGLIVGDGDW